MMNKNSLLLLVCILLFPPGTVAQLRLHGLFSDRMVVQRDRPVNISGYAAPKESVTVEIGGKQIRVRSDREGRWSAVTDPLPVGGPYRIVIRTKTEEVVLSDVLSGDIWVCSGQSNMEYGLFLAEGGEQETEESANDRIRLFTVPRGFCAHPQTDIQETCHWQHCQPQHTKWFSAVAYFFGKYLIEGGVDVPIGLINSAMGGTDIQPWITPQAMEGIEWYRELLAEKTPEVIDAEIRTDTGEIKTVIPNSYPSLLYNKMIAPLTDFPITGVIWYQGENNTWDGYRYRYLFEALIGGWRGQWGQGDFPFYWVQLPNYGPQPATPAESHWAELRDSQTSLLRLTHTGQVVTIDIGDADDLHPRNKRDVGRRLALCALDGTYGRSPYHYFRYDSHRIVENRVIVSLSGTGGEIRLNNRYGYVNGFALCGPDQQFRWAQAELHGDKIVVSHPEIATPVAVRYAWEDNPEDVNLYNADSLPLAPFSTQENR